MAAVSLRHYCHGHGEASFYMDEPNGQTGILVQNINDMLASLELPIVVDTPYDLTPSLLIAILESILRDRLPISNTTRNSQTSASKVEGMKVFLGILEDDVLQADIGLSEIDPRRLAAGEWEEVVFVGETLCWLAHLREQVHHTPADHPETYSSGDSRRSNSVDVVFSGCATSETSATTVEDAITASVLDSPSPAPRCIHEIDTTSSSFDDVQSAESESCDCSLDPNGDLEHEDASHDNALPLAVRYDGLIKPVKGDIEDFESWRERSKLRHASQVPISMNLQRSDSALHNPTGHTSPMQYTITLLNERARLFEELAKLKIAGVQGI